MNPELEKRINHIESLRDSHLSALKELLEADNSNCFGLDFLVAAALKRSWSLCSGFCILVRSSNYQCSAVLVRMQLDSAMRLYAAFIVEKPHDFTIRVLKGERISKMFDRHGNKMTDKFLRESLSKEYEWVSRVYEETSGFVHLSNKHIYSIFTENSEDSFNLIISATDEHILDEHWIEMADAFLACTDVLFEYFRDCIFTKQNPEQVAKMAESKT